MEKKILELTNDLEKLLNERDSNMIFLYKEGVKDIIKEGYGYLYFYLPLNRENYRIWVYENKIKQISGLDMDMELIINIKNLLDKYLDK